MASDFRSGQDLDDEDSVASRAAGIRQGQIIQKHDAIQAALQRMEDAQSTTPGIPEGGFPDPSPGKGNFNAARFLAEGTLQDEISERIAPNVSDARGAKRRAGFSAILPDLAEETAEAAAPVAGGVAASRAGAAAAAGGGGAAAGGVGGLGAAGLGAAGLGAIAAQQAIEAASPDPQQITAPGGGKTVTNQQDDLRDLLEVQKKVAKIGLPQLGGPSTNAAGSRL